MPKKLRPKEFVNDVPNVKAVWVGQDLFFVKDEPYVHDDIQQETRDSANL